jgi:multidrug resistance efflux pump
VSSIPENATLSEESIEAGSDGGRFALWANLAAAGTLEEYARSWLTLQSSLISSTLEAVLVMSDEGAEGFTPVAFWSAGGDSDGERLAEIVESVLQQRRPLLTELPFPPDAAPGATTSPRVRRYAVACPLIFDEQLHGVAAIEVAVSSQEDLRSSMVHLQWGVPLLELFIRRRQTREDGQVISRLRSAIDLLADVLSKENFDAACMAFVTGIAARLSCDRVSLGFVKQHDVRIQAISHSALFDKRTRFIRSLAMVMDEAILQGTEIVYPQPPGAIPLIVRSHDEFAAQYGVKAMLTIPLYDQGRYYGALTLERNGETSFGPEDMSTCKSVFALAAPALEGKRVQSLNLAAQMYGAGQRGVKSLLGPGHPVIKLVLLAAAALVVVFSFASGEYRVTANATLEGSVRRAIAAPIKGYIRQAYVRHGDTVREGSIMCSLDERDLRLERTNLAGQESQFLRQHQEAVALHDRAKANVIKAQLDQVIAQLDLTEIKLQRTTIRAPFDGLVLSGDLSQKLGSAVDQGEVLFEIAPLTGYRLILQVNEAEIANVREGQRGVLVLSALPDTFGFTVTKITPISTTLEGKNCFRVEASLDRAAATLRPGMEGIGKVAVERRKLISIWTLKLRNWFRLWLWSWRP